MAKKNNVKHTPWKKILTEDQHQAAATAEKERAAREQKQKDEARKNTLRAQSHLKDYAARLREDGMEAMAAEIDQVRDGLDMPILMLGFSVAKTLTFSMPQVTEHPDGKRDVKMGTSHWS